MRRSFPTPPYCLVQRHASPLYWAPANTRHIWGYFCLVFRRAPEEALEFLQRQQDILDAWAEVYEALSRPRRARYLRWQQQSLERRWNDYRSERLGGCIFSDGLEE